MELDSDSYLTVEKLCEVLHCGKRWAYNLVNQPDFPSIRLGHKYLIPKEELHKWLRRYLYKSYEF